MLKGAKINSHSWLESCIIGWRCKVGRWVSANVYVKSILGFKAQSRVSDWPNFGVELGWALIHNWVGSGYIGLKWIELPLEVDWARLIWALRLQTQVKLKWVRTEGQQYSKGLKAIHIRGLKAVLLDGDRIRTLDKC